MGMSSSQARLLNLTARMHQIEYKAAKLEAMKLQMANESTRVYEDYLNALEASKVQYKTITTDAAITFNDATYNALCFGYAGDRYALVSPETGEVYVNSTIYDAFNSYPNSPEGFATALTGYTPPVPPTTVLPSIPYTPPETTPQNNSTNIALARKDSSQNGAEETINAGDTITLTLSNVIGSNSDYGYTITTLDPEQDANISVQYLDNGRLVVSGNNLSITANGGQADDIILLGSNNEVNTLDGDDIVRVAQCRDSSGTYSGTSRNNTINTGTGNDHVTLYDRGNALIDGDKVNVLYSNSSVQANTNTMSANVTSEVNTASNGDINSQSLNTIEGHAAQTNANDCRLFSLINSLGKNTNHGDLSEYVTITPTASGYNVKFNNYNGSGSDNINISEAVIANYDGVTGDLTTALIDYALNQLMYANKDDDRLSASVTDSSNAFSRADYNTVAQYFFGNRNFAMYTTDRGDNVMSKVVDMWEDYNNPDSDVTNLLVGFVSDNAGLGIYSGHAYSVKNVVLNSDNSINYVEVINPWDDGDVVRLDGATFRSYCDHCYTFGSSEYNMPITVFTNATSPTDNPESIVLKVNSATTAEEAEWYYYYNLHNEILQNGMIPLTDENAQNPTWLVNVINGGFAYLKVLDPNTRKFVDTSVATNTSLQEVQDKTLLKKAEAKYESDMKRIDHKDRRYDSDLAALETERNAIKQEIETLKTVARDNVERTFKLFS